MLQAITGPIVLDAAFGKFGSILPLDTQDSPTTRIRTARLPAPGVRWQTTFATAGGFANAGTAKANTAAEAAVVIILNILCFPQALPYGATWGVTQGLYAVKLSQEASFSAAEAEA